MTSFTTTKQIGEYGRGGVLHTRRGDVLTPTFMPDGTRGVVKSLTAEQVKSAGIDIVLANTYHLHLQPGEAVVKKLGGLHGFGKWQGPILSDSGGFQVFSLSKLRKITEEGVTFKHPVTGEMRFISPEISMQIQLELGADMIVAFDHLTGLDESASRRTSKDTQEAFDRTHRWLERSIKEFKRLTADMEEPQATHLDAEADFSSSNGPSRTEKYGEGSSRRGKSASAPKPIGSAASSARGQADGVRGLRERPLLFGVVQGGLDLSLREKSLKIIQDSDVDGIAIGGLSVGEPRAEMYKVLSHLAPLYDPTRPHFLLGVGEPGDLRYAIEHGIDMLDCVLPTRNARHATVWRLRETAHSGRSPASSVLDVPDARLRSDARAPSQTAPSHATASAASETLDEQIHLTNAQFIDDASPIMEGCDCYTCANGYSRGFLRHQFKVGEPLAGSLCSIHNLRYLQRICESYRKDS
jgi:queuine tRNA-ribosyltransferase